MTFSTILKTKKCPQNTSKPKMFLVTKLYREAPNEKNQKTNYNYT
jgi:hypothetical protein